MLTMQALPQPVIARVHGIATAAGCQLVAACDLAVASTDARFATSGINFGLFCATPGVPVSRNISRKRAFEMLFTGEFIDAATALDWGLVNSVVPPSELDAELARLVGLIVEKPRAVCAAGKALFYEQLEARLRAGVCGREHARSRATCWARTRPRAWARSSRSASRAGTSDRPRDQNRQRAIPSRSAEAQASTSPGTGADSVTTRAAVPSQQA